MIKEVLMSGNTVKKYDQYYNEEQSTKTSADRPALRLIKSALNVKEDTSPITENIEKPLVKLEITVLILSIIIPLILSLSVRSYYNFTDDVDLNSTKIRMGIKYVK